MHIKDVQKFLKCPRLYQLSLTDDDRPFPYFNININIRKSIVNKLGIKKYYEGIPNENNEDTFEAFNHYDWVVNARFVYRGLRCRIPFVRKAGEEFDLYFSLLNLNPTVNDADNIIWAYSFLTKLNLRIRQVYLLHLNPDYIRKGKLNHELLWLVSDCFHTPGGLPAANVKEYLDRNILNMDSALDSLLHFDSDDDFSAVRSAKCSGHNKCRYYDICFPEEKDLPVDSILRLAGSQHKYEMFNDNIRYLSQADLMKIEGTKQQYAQIMADKLGGLYFDGIALNSWLTATADYPLSFVDFEWDIHAIPPYQGMRPLEVLPFQYSLDVLNEDGSRQHYQYIGEKDCRREFISRLLSDLPDKGTIYAYSAFGAEIIRLNLLAEQFPEYSERINDAVSRFVDFAMPFVRGTVYDIRMKGSYSLKSVQAVVSPDHTYGDLDVMNGLEAVKTYRQLMKTTDQNLKDRYYQELYDYCGLDSYAMLQAYNWLKEINTRTLV